MCILFIWPTSYVVYNDLPPLPILSGTVGTGNTLTVIPGRPGSTLAWYADGVLIAGETGLTYVIGAGVGTSFTVHETLDGITTISNTLGIYSFTVDTTFYTVDSTIITADMTVTL